MDVAYLTPSAPEAQMSGTEDLYGTHRFPDPDAAQLRAWLGPFIGSDHAAELADAVDAAPPPAAWRPHNQA
jgi:hypothetical protein